MHHETAGAEQRKQVRYARGLDVFFRQEGDAEAMMHYARVRDMSSAGVGLVSEWPLQRAAVLQLIIMDRHGDPAVCVSAEVRHVRPKGPNRWVVGCQFMQRLSETEWTALEMN
jgi:hypothetical protein